MVTSDTYPIPGDIELFFADSGAPPNSVDYTTLVVLHGTAFHGTGFKQLHEYAHALNMRTILVNRRDYPGSSKLTPSEIEEIASGRKEFVHRLGIQLGEFLTQLIEREGIPTVTLSEDGKEMKGGIAIMGWSFGNVTAMSLFAAPNLEHYALLEQYLRNLVLYDPPLLCFGCEIPEDNPNYIPWLDPSLETPEDVQKAFGPWVSSYYDHKNMTSSTTIHELDGRKSTDEMALSQWSEEELRKHIDPEAASRELQMFLPPMQKTLRVVSDVVLFDKESIEASFPKVTVTYIGATRTAWMCAWGEIETKRRYEQNGGEGRRIKFLDVEGANHFVHMTQPRQFLQLVATGIHDTS